MKGITAPILGGRTEKQLRENVGSFAWSLETKDFFKIDQLSRDFWNEMPNYKHFFDTTIVE
jgi:aryl-alcohol dehydrogenase-like predicted oxidoreductase